MYAHVTPVADLYVLDCGDPGPLNLRITLEAEIVIPMTWQAGVSPSPFATTGYWYGEVEVECVDTGTGSGAELVREGAGGKYIKVILECAIPGLGGCDGFAVSYWVENLYGIIGNGAWVYWHGGIQIVCSCEPEFFFQEWFSVSGPIPVVYFYEWFCGEVAGLDSHYLIIEMFFDGDAGTGGGGTGSISEIEYECFYGTETEATDYAAAIGGEVTGGPYYWQSECADQCTEVGTGTIISDNCICTLNGLSAAAQTLSTVANTNVTLGIASTGANHQFTVGWTGQLAVGRGGTGLDGSTAANGTLLIGNGAGFSLATLTEGTGIEITNAAGSITIAATAAGSVTSVALVLPTGEFTVSGSPVTGSGTLTAVWDDQTANKVFASPGSGDPGVPTFRALVWADLGISVSTALSVSGSTVRGYADKRATVWGDEFTPIAGTFADLPDTNQRYGTLTYNSTHAINDSAGAGVFLKAGTYTMVVLGGLATTVGKVRWYLDGGLIADDDWYGTSTYNIAKATTSITVSTDGWHELHWIVYGKNASSSDYYFYLTKAFFLADDVEDHT